MDGMLLQSVEAIGDSPFVGTGGEIWELLQAEKEEVSRDLLSEGPLLHDGSGASEEDEASEEPGREIEWMHREALEDRLRVINDAQDRLMDGGYGLCQECGNHIGGKRLLADPAASLCFLCQQSIERESLGELFSRTL